LPDASPTLFFIYPRDGIKLYADKIEPPAERRQFNERIAQVLKKNCAETPFEYSFVNDDFNKKFTERTHSKVASSFAVLAILISCLGLFGMASFMAEQRIKKLAYAKYWSFGL